MSILESNNAYITPEQFNHLNSLILNDDRVAFYVELNKLTGNPAALDMAEISSSSGIRGGAAQLINEYYEIILNPQYPHRVRWVKLCRLWVSLRTPTKTINP